MKNTSDQLYFQYLLLQLFRKSNDQDIHWRHCPYMKASKKMEGVALSYSIYGSVQFVCMAELFILLKRALDEKKHNCSRDAPDFSIFLFYDLWILHVSVFISWRNHKRAHKNFRSSIKELQKCKMRSNYYSTSDH